MSSFYRGSETAPAGGRWPRSGRMRGRVYPKEFLRPKRNALKSRPAVPIVPSQAVQRGRNPLSVSAPGPAGTRSTQGERLMRSPFGSRFDWALCAQSKPASPGADALRGFADSSMACLWDNRDGRPDFGSIYVITEIRN